MCTTLTVTACRWANYLRIICCKLEGLMNSPANQMGKPQILVTSSKCHLAHGMFFCTTSSAQNPLNIFWWELFSILTHHWPYPDSIIWKLKSPCRHKTTDYKEFQLVNFEDTPHSQVLFRTLLTCFLVRIYLCICKITVRVDLAILFPFIMKEKNVCRWALLNCPFIFSWIS